MAVLFVFVFGKKSQLIKSKQKAGAVESQRLPCRSSKEKERNKKLETLEQDIEQSFEEHISYG